MSLKSFESSVPVLKQLLQQQRQSNKSSNYMNLSNSEFRVNIQTNGPNEYGLLENVQQQQSSLSVQKPVRDRSVNQINDRFRAQTLSFENVDAVSDIDGNSRSYSTHDKSAQSQITHKKKFDFINAKQKQNISMKLDNSSNGPKQNIGMKGILKTDNNNNKQSIKLDDETQSRSSVKTVIFNPQKKSVQIQNQKEQPMGQTSKSAKQIGSSGTKHKQSKSVNLLSQTHSSFDSQNFIGTKLPTNQITKEEKERANKQVRMKNYLAMSELNRKLTKKAQISQTKDDNLNNYYNLIKVERDEKKLIFIDSLELLRGSAFLCLQANYEKGTIACLNSMVRSCANCQELYLLKSIYSQLAHVYLHYNRFEYAIQTLEKLKDVAESNNDYHSLIDVYKRMGQCCQRTKKNQEALLCFQSMMQYSWLTNNTAAEIQAYDFLSLLYFNMGDLDNSRYYRDRALRQVVEPRESRTRYLATQELKWKQQERDKSRIIQFKYEPGIDSESKAYNRLHYTQVRFEKKSDYNQAKDRTTVHDVQNYKNANILREVTLLYLEQVIVEELEQFELANGIATEENQQIFIPDPPCKFQQETIQAHLTAQNVNNKGYTWAERFLMAGFIKDSDVESSLKNKYDNKSYQVRQGTAMQDKDYSRLPYLGKKSIKNKKGEMDDDQKEAIEQDKDQNDDGVLAVELLDSKKDTKFTRFLRRIICGNKKIDYLKEEREEKRERDHKKKMLENGTGQINMKVLLAKSHSNKAKLKQTLFMNHLSPAKLRKTTGKIRDQSFWQIKEMFEKLKKELHHEKNYAQKKTFIVKQNALTEKARELYCYNPIEKMSVTAKEFGFQLDKVTQNIQEN